MHYLMHWVCTHSSHRSKRNATAGVGAAPHHHPSPSPPSKIIPGGGAPQEQEGGGAASKLVLHASRSTAARPNAVQLQYRFNGSMQHTYQNQAQYCCGTAGSEAHLSCEHGGVGAKPLVELPLSEEVHPDDLAVVRVRYMRGVCWKGVAKVQHGCNTCVVCAGRM